jgi:hypothetical protein
LRSSRANARYESTFDTGERLRPDHQEFVDGLRLATIAVIAAAVSATVVIGAGRALLPRPDPVAEAQTQLIRTVSR